MHASKHVYHKKLFWFRAINQLVWCSNNIQLFCHFLPRGKNKEICGNSHWTRHTTTTIDIRRKKNARDIKQIIWVGRQFEKTYKEVELNKSRKLLCLSHFWFLLSNAHNNFFSTCCYDEELFWLKTFSWWDQIPSLKLLFIWILIFKW